MIRQVFVASAVGALTGGFAGLVLLIGDVIGKLYLSGHNREPPWYDSVAAAIVFGGAFIAFCVAFRVTFHERRRS